MRNDPHGVDPWRQNANASKKRNDDTLRTCAGPRHSRAIDGNGLALLRGYPGHHRQAQRDRLEHRAAPAGEPSAAPGLQGHASLVGEIEGVHPAIGWVEVKIKLILDSPSPSEALRRLKNGHGERLDGHVEEGCTRLFMSGQRGAFSATR